MTWIEIVRSRNKTKVRKIMSREQRLRCPSGFEPNTTCHYLHGLTTKRLSFLKESAETLSSCIIKEGALCGEPTDQSPPMDSGTLIRKLVAVLNFTQKGFVLITVKEPGY